MGSFETSLISVGVDYVTATEVTNGSHTKLGELSAQWIHDEARAGNEVREWSSHGYIGLWSGSVGAATNGSRLLVKIAGAEAQAHAVQLLTHAHSVSRLDLQTTVHIPHVPLSFAERLERRARCYKHKHKLSFDVDLRRHDRKGNTLYLGSRSSERFIRVYDKGRESGHPDLRDCWRAEVQFNKPMSDKRAKQLLAMQLDQQWVSEVVVYELKRRGVPWYPLDGQAVPEQPSGCLRRRTDALRKLDWIQSQVKPTVEWLMDHGFGEQLLYALGFANQLEENDEPTSANQIQCRRRLSGPTEG